MRPRYLELSEQQRNLIEKFICKSNRKAISKALDVDFRLVRSYVSHLEKERKIPRNRTKGSYNEQLLKEIFRAGNESTMLRKLFVKREGLPWSPQEDSLLEDNAGERSDFEIGVLLGRTEMAVAKRRARLGIDAVDNSGYWTVDDVANTTGLTIKQVRRRVERGLLEKIEGSGKSTKEVVVSVSKLRFYLRPGAKDKVVSVSKAFTKIKKGMFSRVLFFESAVNSFVEKYLQSSVLPCIFCSNKAKGSIYCHTCRIEPEVVEKPVFKLSNLAKVRTHRLRST